MVKLNDKVNFIDERGNEFNGFVQKIHGKTVDIQVCRKIGSMQMYLKVPTPNAKKTNKPFYTEITARKETPKKKE